MCETKDKLSGNIYMSMNESRDDCRYSIKTLLNKQGFLSSGVFKFEPISFERVGDKILVDGIPKHYELSLEDAKELSFQLLRLIGSDLPYTFAERTAREPSPVKIELSKDVVTYPKPLKAHNE
jgi:hypothetical protein